MSEFERRLRQKVVLSKFSLPFSTVCETWTILQENPAMEQLLSFSHKRQRLNEYVGTSKKRFACCSWITRTRRRRSWHVDQCRNGNAGLMKWRLMSTTAGSAQQRCWCCSCCALFWRKDGTLLRKWLRRGLHTYTAYVLTSSCYCRYALGT